MGFVCRMSNIKAVSMSVWNDVRFPRVLSLAVSVAMFAIPLLMEEAVSNTVPDGQYAPFEFCCFWWV